MTLLLTAWLLLLALGFVEILEDNGLRTPGKTAFPGNTALVHVEHTQAPWKAGQSTPVNEIAGADQKVEIAI